MEPLLSSSSSAPVLGAAARAAPAPATRRHPPQPPHQNRNQNQRQAAATALKAQEIMTATGMCRVSSSSSSSSLNSNSSTGSLHHFPSRLHDMLDGAERHQHTSIVSWCPDGRAFRIHQPEFMLPVLKQYFRQTKYKSLLRQLQAYNFARTTKGERKGTVSHPHFQRGRRSLCLAMKRKPKGATAAAAQHALVAQQQQATLMLPLAAAGEASSSSLSSGHVAKSAVKTKKMKTKKPATAPRGSSRKGKGRTPVATARTTSAGGAAAAAATAAVAQRGPTPPPLGPTAFGAASSPPPGLHPPQPPQPYHPQSQSPLQPLPPPERLQQQKQLLEQHLQVQQQQQRQHQEQQWLALTEDQRQQLVTYFKTNNTGRVELSHLPQQQHLLQQQLLQQPAAANIPCHSRGYSDTLMDSLRVEIGCTVSSSSTPTPTPSSHHMTSSEQHGPAAVVSSDSLCSNSKSKTLLAKNFAAAAGASGPGVSVPIPVEHVQLQTATVTAPSTLFPQQQPQRRRSTGMMMNTAAVPKTSSTVSSFIKRYSSPTFAPTGVTVSTLQQQRRQQRHPPLHHHHHQPPSLERLRHHDRFASPLGELNITLSCATRPEDAPPTTRTAAFQNHYILPPMFEPTPLALTATPSSEKYYQLYHATVDTTTGATTAMAPSEEPVPVTSTSAAASAELTLGRCYHDVGDDAVCEECGYDGGGDDDHVTAGLVVDELMLPSCSDDIDAGIAEAFNVF